MKNTGRRTVMKGLGFLGAAGLLTGRAAAREHEEREREGREGDDEDEDAGVDRHGPMKTGRFEVHIDEVEVPGWQSVTIPSVSVEQGEYREGNDAKWEEKVWGQPSFDDLEMERGVKPGATRIWDWRKAVNSNADEGRKEIAVKMQDEEGTAQIEWRFLNARIKEYDPPELDSSADGDIATEEISVAFDRMVEARRID